MNDPDLRNTQRNQLSNNELLFQFEDFKKQVRLGKISAENLNLLSHCGYQPAKILLGNSESSEQSDFRDWIQDLYDQFGFQPSLYALVFLTKRLLPIWTARHPADNRLAKVIDLLEKWIAEADPTLTKLLNAAGDEACDAAAETEHLNNSSSIVASTISCLADFALGAHGNLDDILECINSVFELEQHIEKANIFSELRSVITNWALG